MEARVYLSHSTDPYLNLSVERYLTGRVKKGEACLFLWQNENTIVIGRNQNPYVECDMDQVRQDGVRIARRFSGGGAVYHDMGNLNFSFIHHRSEQRIETNLSVILRALEAFGLHAEFTGRNDICIDNRKFSGNAFFLHQNGACHHGTLLVAEDHDKIRKYLTVSKLKLQAKGIASVKSRVVNLSDLNPDITISSLKEQLAKAFMKTCGTGITGASAENISEEAAMGMPEIRALREMLASHAWIYGESPEYAVELKDRFPWGEVSIGLSLHHGKITACRIYTDCLEADAFAELERNLAGMPYGREKVWAAVQNHVAEPYRSDLQALFYRML